eukprot:1632129-Rhodomonas_salina.2
MKPSECANKLEFDLLYACITNFTCLRRTKGGPNNPGLVLPKTIFRRGYQPLLRQARCGECFRTFPASIMRH